MNEIENDYIQIELPNVFLEREKLKNAANPYTAYDLEIHEFIAPLITRLAKARPQWSFIATRVEHIRDRQVHAARMFLVFKGSTSLGKIEYEYSYGASRGDTVSITNDRISDKLKRGLSIKTKDMKKAFKVVVENFYGPTLDEQTSKAIKDINRVVYNQDRTAQVKFSEKYLSNTVQDFLPAFIVGNWDVFREAAVAAGIDATILDGMPERYNAQLTAQLVSSQSATGGGSYVFIYGNQYIVQENGIKTILDTDQIPPHMKRSIGILKMLASNGHVEGHGVRAGPDKFFITSKGETPE